MSHCPESGYDEVFQDDRTGGGLAAKRRMNTLRVQHKSDGILLAFFLDFFISVSDTFIFDHGIMGVVVHLRYRGKFRKESIVMKIREHLDRGGARELKHHVGPSRAMRLNRDPRAVVEFHLIGKREVTRLFNVGVIESHHVVYDVDDELGLKEGTTPVASISDEHVQRVHIASEREVEGGINFLAEGSRLLDPREEDRIEPRDESFLGAY